MIVSKNCYLTQIPFKIDRKGMVVSVTTLLFTRDLEVCLQRFQLISWLSPWRPFRFSVWWFDNLHFNSCSLKRLQNALFDMSFIKVNQNPNTIRFRGKWPIHLLFVCCLMVTTRKQIYLFPNCVFYWHHGISYSYNSFCRHIGADFNGQFLTGCCCVKNK